MEQLPSQAEFVNDSDVAVTIVVDSVIGVGEGKQGFGNYVVSETFQGQTYITPY